MLRLSFGARPGPLSVLCLGAHSDDIEIGCGGTLMRLLDERPDSSVRWVVFSAYELRAREARSSAAAFTADARKSDVTVHGFRESYFPFEGGAIKEAFAALAAEIDPDIVFTHRRDDLHQDHRIIAELTWNHFRDHLILEYEIAKYEGDLGHPNLYTPLTAELAEAKSELLLEHFKSQLTKTWFKPEVFRGLMALRGIECNSPSGLAEAFHVRKVTL